MLNSKPCRMCPDPATAARGLCWKHYRLDRKGRAVVKRGGCRATIHRAGEVFNHFTIVGRSSKKPGTLGWYWRVRCVCGKEMDVLGVRLRRGVPKSCGCRNPSYFRGEANPGWKGGRYVSTAGYVYVNVGAGHPNANQRGYMLEHLFVMAAHLGRPLKKGESVHHKNGRKDDNRIQNLELWHSSHRFGQRIDDLIEHAIWVLQNYAPERLAD